MRFSADNESLSPNNVGGDRETGRPSDGFGVGQELRSASTDVAAPTEEWRPVPVDGYGHAYDVSSLGRVRRVLPAMGTRPGKILVGSIGGNGYRVVNLSVGCERFPKNVHELVALAFLGPPPDGYEVDHRDHDRGNARLDNLRYLTRKANNDCSTKTCGNCGERGHTSCGHRDRSGPFACSVCGKEGHNRVSCPTRAPAETAYARGESMYTAKLTEAQVREIRATATKGQYRELGRLYGVAGNTIKRIANGRGWTHVDAAPSADHAVAS
jgi:hypothetical protein